MSRLAPRRAHEDSTSSIMASNKQGSIFSTISQMCLVYQEKDLERGEQSGKLAALLATQLEELGCRRRLRGQVWFGQGDQPACPQACQETTIY
jgi:hypothetical protein